jgi:hypothetical protein
MLGGLEPDDRVDPDSLASGLNHSNEDVVFWTIIGIGRLRARGAACLPDVIAIAANHARADLRQAAIAAIAKIATDDSATKNALLAALRDPSPSVRRETLQALVHLPGLSSVDLEAIRELQHDADKTVVRWAKMAVAAIERRNRSLQ